MIQSMPAGEQAPPGAGGGVPLFSSVCAIRRLVVCGAQRADTLNLLAVVEATLDKHVRPDCTVQYIPGYLVKDADQLHHPAGGRKAEAELRLFVSFDTSNVFWFPL
jgi:hypothetical protein